MSIGIGGSPTTFDNLSRIGSTFIAQFVKHKVSRSSGIYYNSDYTRTSETPLRFSLFVSKNGYTFFWSVIFSSKSYFKHFTSLIRIPINPL